MSGSPIFFIQLPQKVISSSPLGHLVEEGKLDFDTPIRTYLPDFPTKQFDGEEVDITLRQLLSHTSGIRGYFEKERKKGNHRVSIRRL